MDERKPEEFETDIKKWKVYFDKGEDCNKGSSCIDVRFAKSEHQLTPADIQELKQDIHDLGKLRIIKQGKDFLENGSSKFN